MEDAVIDDPSFPVTTIPGSPSSRQVLAACPPRFPRKPECSVFFEGFLDRLNACHHAVAVHDDQWKNKYCELLKRFMKLLRRQPLLERLAGADTIAYTFRELNSRLDAICVGIEYAANDQWMADWSHGCEVQAQQLESLVTGTAARMLIRDMASEQKVTTAMLEMYTWLEGNTPGPLPDLKRATLERLRVALDLEARVITSETVAGIQGQTDNILSIFRWFIPERDVEVNEGGLVGAGTYGTVDYGTWRRRDGTIQDVVIKSMFDRSIDSELAFLRQLQLWYELPRHPNIIQLHGGCHRARQPFFVCENAPGGNIFQFFSELENQDMFWSMFLQVAQGLQVLHEHHIVHDGLKSGNILIGENNTPKISDFDCSRIRTISAGYSNQTQQFAAESVRWKPREKLVEANDALPRYKSDVYSMGMCMIEAKTQVPPFGYYDDDEVMERVLSGAPYEQPDKTFDDEEWNVISRLIAVDIEDRPDMGEAVNLIAKLVLLPATGA
ncbi:Tyrosine-protein kinase Btk29A [Phytophthora ramorum]|uniref:Tyrosine-protein kinase Btk29A n=1 Tax=Phytophthora ramorum TaxID=164328 RepID=UPI0030A983A9|nr:Tyrosine-protein kinase Btk29A [Phytophthora ramorum]